MYKLIAIAFFVHCVVFAQFSPAVGEMGCKALHMDSHLFSNWAERGEVVRGWMNISDTTLGKASFGVVEDAYGLPNPAVVSLGDGGFATFYFELPVIDGAGYDFAVFENAFDDYFLELAFVEVSSDGRNFVRFQPHSLTETQSQLGPFDLINTEKIHNLAGKYRGQWGTPFDLNELNGSPDLDLDAIHYIRIVDVVGSIDTLYASFDLEGRMINDPWPTPFEQGGFDLDAIGVIHQKSLSVHEHQNVLIYPNPVSIGSHLSFASPFPIENIKLIDAIGRVMRIDYSSEIDLLKYIKHAGLYVLEYEIWGEKKQHKLIVKE